MFVDVIFAAWRLVGLYFGPLAEVVRLKSVDVFAPLVAVLVRLPFTVLAVALAVAVRAFVLDGLPELVLGVLRE